MSCKIFFLIIFYHIIKGHGGAILGIPSSAIAMRKDANKQRYVPQEINPNLETFPFTSP